jgi:hypothetical protein
VGRKWDRIKERKKGTLDFGWKGKRERIEAKQLIFNCPSSWSIMVPFFIFFQE